MQKRLGPKLVEDITNYLDQMAGATLENLSEHFKISNQELVLPLNYLKSNGIVESNNRIVRIYEKNHSKKLVLTLYVYSLTETGKIQISNGKLFS